MIAHAVVFYIFSLIAIVSAIMVTVSRNTVHSVFFLILDFISISCLFIMIGAEFLGMIMLIVYVGAVAVLFLFVVMMLNVAQQKNQWFLSKSSSNHIPTGLIISSIIFFEFKFLARAKLSNSLKKATRIAKKVFEKSFIDSASVEVVNKIFSGSRSDIAIRIFENLIESLQSPPIIILDGHAHQG